VAQTAKPIQQPTARTAEWLGRQGGGFVGAVWFSEQSVADAPTEEMIGCREQAHFRGNRADDKVGMFGAGRQELARCLHGGMNRLHKDLG
jgi:hypothetical protein